MGTLKSAPKLISNGIRRPVPTISSAAEMAMSVYRTVRPVNRTGSPLMKKRSLVRRLGVLEVPFPQLRAAAHRSGGALNDAFVAGVAGGLRRYHEKRGVAVGDLHLTMPMSLREEGDEMGGNRITVMRFDVPAGVADPARANPRDPRKDVQGASREVAALHAMDRRCPEHDAAVVHRLDPAPCRLPVQ